MKMWIKIVLVSFVVLTTGLKYYILNTQLNILSAEPLKLNCIHSMAVLEGALSGKIHLLIGNNNKPLECREEGSQDSPQHSDNGSTTL